MKVVPKEIVQAKLTVAKDRVEFKYPLAMDPLEVARVERMAEQVAKLVSPVEHTVRGRFFYLEGVYSVTMQTENRKDKRYRRFWMGMDDAVHETNLTKPKEEATC